MHDETWRRKFPREMTDEERDAHLEAVGHEVMRLFDGFDTRGLGNPTNALKEYIRALRAWPMVDLEPAIDSMFLRSDDNRIPACGTVYQAANRFSGERQEREHQAEVRRVEAQYTKSARPKQPVPRGPDLRLVKPEAGQG